MKALLLTVLLALPCLAKLSLKKQANKIYLKLALLALYVGLMVLVFKYLVTAEL